MQLFKFLLPITLLMAAYVFAEEAKVEPELPVDDEKFFEEFMKMLESGELGDLGNADEMKALLEMIKGGGMPPEADGPKIVDAEAESVEKGDEL